MPTLKKGHFYRYRENKTGVNVVPLEDREVSNEIYNNYIEVEGSEVKREE